MLNAALRIVSLGRPATESQSVSSIFGSAAGLAESIEASGALPHLCLSYQLQLHARCSYGPCFVPLLFVGTI